MCIVVVNQVETIDLFPEMHAIAWAHAGTHTSKSMCGIHCMHIIIVFHFLLLLLSYTSCKDKFFIEGSFIEDYLKEI